VPTCQIDVPRVKPMRLVRFRTKSSCWTSAGEVIYATPVIINHQLIVVGAALAVRDLAAGPADKSSWRANGRTAMPSAVRPEPRSARRPMSIAGWRCARPSAWNGLHSLRRCRRAGAQPELWPSTPTAGKRQQEERRDGWAGETGCSGVSAGQSILLACGLDTPLVDLLAGP